MGVLTIQVNAQSDDLRVPSVTPLTFGGHDTFLLGPGAFHFLWNFRLVYVV